jgi:imidazolonepropionase-like amidohydrolase
MLILAACLLLKNATVIDPRAGTVSRHDVRIGDSKPCVERDVAGRYIVPGFADMHVHLLAHPWDEKGNLRPRYDRATVEQMLRTFLAFGVTTIRDPGSETEAAVTFRKLLADHKIIGPRLITAGRIINASDFDPEPFMPVHSADDIRREIRYQADAGVDFIKIYSSMTPELTKVAIDEAHAHHLKIIGHLQRTTWTDAANLGIDGVEHAAPWSVEYMRDPAGYRGTMFDRVHWLEKLDSAKIAEMIAALAKHRVVVDPTLIAMHTKFFGNDPRWLRNPDNELAPPLHRTGWDAFSFTKDWTDEQYREAQAAWPLLLKLTKDIFDGGVPMVVGTDTPTPWIVPGASFHDEMRLLRDAGIPPMAILKMATIANGDYVVLAKNPLDDISNTRAIVTVIHDGIEYDPATLLHK